MQKRPSRHKHDAGPPRWFGGHDSKKKKKRALLKLPPLRTSVFIISILTNVILLYFISLPSVKLPYEPGFEHPSVRTNNVRTNALHNDSEIKLGEGTKIQEKGNVQGSTKAPERAETNNTAKHDDTTQRQDNVQIRIQHNFNQTKSKAQDSSANPRVLFDNRPGSTKVQLYKRTLPRTVALLHKSDDTMAVAIMIHKKPTPPFKSDSMPQSYKIEPDWYDWNARDYLEMKDQCEPIDEWQVSSFSNCVKFHEQDLKSMSMINKGGSRIAFELNQDIDGKQSKFVYKTIKYSRYVDSDHVEQQRKDALLMERASSSKFIPNIYGYCGIAVMMDFMKGGNMHDYIKGSRIAGGSTLAPVDKLRIAIHIATSVADLHDIGGKKIPTFFHNDICCHQFLFQDGIFKLNDFNYARPILVKKGTNEMCLRESSLMGMWKGRSIEDHLRYIRDPSSKPYMSEKADVWMMGNIIYIILTDLYTFEWPKNLSIKETSEKLKEGARSEYPVHIAKSTDPSNVAMKKALDMCWVQDFSERPSARKVSDYLMGQLRTITGEKNPDLKVILPDRDENQRPTDSEFNKYGY